MRTNNGCPTQNPVSALSPLPGRDCEGVGSGVTAFQTTVSDDSVGTKAEEGPVVANSAARTSGPFRSVSCKAASLRFGLREIEEGEVAGRHRQSSSSSLTRDALLNELHCHPGGSRTHRQQFPHASSSLLFRNEEFSVVLYLFHSRHL